jgi:LysR family transcriptional regulator, low CO2-responsive transcriptional regulator
MVIANMLTRPNLDALQSFAVFTETLNFSLAAVSLNISQPALHVKIRKLSEQLDLPLYRRVGRKLELTTHGEVVARYGRELLGRTQGFMQELQTGHKNLPLTLAAGNGAYLYLLGTAIQRHLGGASSPTKLLTLDRESAIEAVRSGRADIAVAPLETIPADLEATVLTTVGQVLVVPKSHPLTGRKSLKLRDLSGARLVVPPPGRPHREMLARLLQSAGVNWEVAVEASGWELMLQFVKMGVGTAVVNACCHIPKGLVAVPLPELPSLRFHIFWLRGQSKDGDWLKLKNAMLECRDAWKAR